MKKFLYGNIGIFRTPKLIVLFIDIFIQLKMSLVGKKPFSFHQFYRIQTSLLWFCKISQAPSYILLLITDELLFYMDVIPKTFLQSCVAKILKFLLLEHLSNGGIWIF